MAWLLGADPRGDDLDAPGSEIDTNHEGRIEGRLRQNIDKWRAITKDERVLDLILNGLKLEFVDGVEPPALCSDRNNIPPELEEWTAQQIEAMLRAGAISTWGEHADMLRRRGLDPGERPRVISPILVHEKPSSTPENRKYRFIVDARELNVHLIKRKFKLQSLSEFAKQLRQGDYMWSLDLASAYFHVSVHWRHATYLGFSFQGRDYVFGVLPFGLATSAEAFCAVSSVAARALRDRQIVDALIDYVDDFIGSVGDAPHSKRGHEAARFLTGLGFALNPDKLRLVVARRREGLGHIIDTERMTLSLTARRRQRMVEAVEIAWRDRANVVVKDVARVAGHALSGALVFGLESRLRSRYLLHWVARNAPKGYHQRAPLSSRAAEELDLWRHRAREHVARPMHEYRKPADYVVDCDASDTALAGIIRRAPDPQHIGLCIFRTLSESERVGSSTLREMRGYVHAARTLNPTCGLRPGDVVEFIGDSACAARIFAKGGSQAAFDEVSGELLLLEALLDIYRALDPAGASARFRWMRRTHLVAADALSKHIDRHDFGLRPAAFERLRRELGVGTVDRFAAPHNAVCTRFHAAFASAGAEPGDGFLPCWADDVNFVLPEFTDAFIDRVLDKIEQDNAVVICIVPWWPSKPFWRRLHCAAWAERIEHRITIGADALVPHEPNRTHCFFGERFEAFLLAFRTRRV